ncbi:TPA: hypothetical protein ACN6ZO_001391 [Escherichia albertii]|uniref:Uncharacterized protein n=1 Tax=Escherichia albertii TaxID=208962 RepID=A0ABD7E9V1_ESCAL|nr:hypothetical protein [Escherichia albertii]AHE60404.1 hypothetical protein EAKF1_ch2535 [Escherichia albertii KF1]EFF0773935.1 hypothetical protein [Escherichia albertii]MCQ8983407.1 hypothetical protein [Escherichia albertii]MCQ9014277.1 hypothetical protein [Escherichia albertii]MCV3249746.1 hypothetical protein [Escherichia albertii]
MQPSSAMQALIEQIYLIFRRYPVPQQFVVCCEYCLSQQEQKALRNTSLREIPYSLINAWNSSPGPDPQNSDEVRYFLPRLLEFVAQGYFDNIHEVFTLRRINLASKENWRADERAILQQFACQFMVDWVSGDEVVELQYMLEMFFRADIALTPLLDAVISVPGFWTTTSLAYLLNRYSGDYIRDNQDDIDKAITAQINAWTINNQSILKERARQAIENPLKQPELMTKYQVWEDDWMVDECLCAMSDATLTSPGQ